MVDNKKNKKKRVCIVVLGDFGHSPRMQYHAVSLAENGFMVDVVSFSGSDPHDAVKEHPSIIQYPLRNIPDIQYYLPKKLVFILKVLWQSFFLFVLLFRVPKPSVMMIQNPPAVPALPICWLACILRGTEMMIDFHNYGFSILALSAGKSSYFVNMYKWCEQYFGRKASRTICVTQAMQEDLMQNFHIRSSVFYDCPPEIFHPVSVKEKHQFFLKLSEEYPTFKNSSPEDDDSDVEYTRFTVKNENGISLLNNRPVLLISSTSWTEDEDFSVLFTALQEYEDFATNSENFPKLVVVITGKGPLKEMYERLIAEKNFTYVEIITMWLPAKYYPTMLACADLGVSLHHSSSNLDLPMKIVDMFGSALPVCAYRYPCINELVKENVNGLCFSDSEQLFTQFQELFEGFPDRSEELEKLHNNLIENPCPKWQSNWNKYVLPIVNELISEYPF